ncbi:MAG TPA: RNA polymerase sigma factor [Vicinamibacterales bacterium]|nr:RNA polymerase sigma factor [Vicinamibacterales bacterium]
MTGSAIALPAAADCPRQDVSDRLACLFDAHHQRLFRLARRLAGSSEDARDLVQETFLRAARAPGSVPDDRPNQEAWLVRVLVNISRDRWRRIAVHRQSVLAGRVTTGHASGDPESALLARSLVQQALAQLPPRRRAIVVMYELEGATIPAIARLLGVAPVTVRWHLSTGRREMARMLRGGLQEGREEP